MACQKLCLKLPSNVICSVNENFPLIRVAVDKDNDSLLVCLLPLPCHSFPPSHLHAISLAASVSDLD